jgi:hypothetical protein
MVCELTVGVKLGNRVLLVVSAILCVILLVFAGFSQAQPIASGVKGGMSFFYYISSYWSSSDTYASIPVNFLVINQTAFVEIRIGVVNATDVETNTMCYYNDGEVDFEKGNINLYTGVSSGFAGIIGANLNVGDRIHPDGGDTLTILDTTTRNYESGARVTNHVRIVDNNPEEGYRGTRDLYFDKETGVLVEQVDQVETTVAPITVTRLTWKIASVSSVAGWKMAEISFPVASSTSNPTSGIFTRFHLLLIVLFLLILAGIAIMVYKKKNSKPK